MEILKCRRNVGNLEIHGTNDQTQVYPESPQDDDITLNVDGRIFTVKPE